MCHYCTQNISKQCVTKEWSLDATISTKCRKHLSCEIARRLVEFFLDIGIRFYIGSFGIRLAMAGPVIANVFRQHSEAGRRRGSILLLIWSTRHWQLTDKQIKTWIEKLKQFVFQSSERVRSWLGPVKDAGRPGGWDWNERCSTEHMCRDVPASVTLQSRQHFRTF